MPKKKAAPGKSTALVLKSDTVRTAGHPIGEEKPRCGSKLRKRDATCQSTALFENGRCRIHGGKSLGGIASPTLKHGRFSRVMPTHLADRFEEIKADPQLISMRENLALVNTLLEQRLQEIYEGVPPEAWHLAGELFNELKNVFTGNVVMDPKTGEAIEPRDLDEILEDLGELLAKGIKSSEAFELTEKMLESHRKAVDTEYKLLKDNQNRMDVGEVRAIAIGLGNAVKRYVKDPETLRLIQADMQRFVRTRSDNDA